MTRSFFMILVAAAGALTACTKLANVQCDLDSNCNLSGGGMCKAAPSGNQWCAYPDPRCPSGYSYSTQAVGDGVSGMCVAETAPPVDAGVDAGIDGPGFVPDWVTRHGGTGDDYGLAIAAAPNGDLVMTGSLTGTITLGGASLTAANRYQGWVARYKADGTHVWSVLLGDNTSEGEAVTVDAKGDVYVLGAFQVSQNFGGGIRTLNPGYNGAAVVKLSGATGDYLWDSILESVTLDRRGITIVGKNVAVWGVFSRAIDIAGTIIPSTGDADNFVAVYDPAGKPVWSKALTTSEEDSSGARLTVVDSDILITSSFAGTAMLGGPVLTSVGMRDLFMVRYRGSDGAHMWSLRQGAGISSTIPRGIATDGNLVFVGGQFSYTTNLGGDNLTATAEQGSGEPTDAFLAAYNASDGRYVWSTHFGGPALDSVDSIAANETRLAVSMSFKGTVAIGSQSFTAGPTGDSLIARINRLSGAPEPGITQFASSEQRSVALIYTADRLAGIATFAGQAQLLGSTLVSAGGRDIGAFRVVF